MSQTQERFWSMATMPTLADALVIFVVVVYGMIFAILTCLSRLFFCFTSNSNYVCKFDEKYQITIFRIFIHCMSFNNIPKKNVHMINWIDVFFHGFFSLFFVVEKWLINCVGERKTMTVNWLICVIHGVCVIDRFRHKIFDKLLQFKVFT